MHGFGSLKLPRRKLSSRTICTQPQLCSPAFITIRFSLFASVSWMVVYLKIIAAATVQYSIAVLSFSGILAVAAVTP